MSAKVEESYGYQVVTLTSTLTKMAAGVMGGFICSTSGTISLNTIAGDLVLLTTPVTAGTFLPLPFTFPPGVGVIATLAGGADGTFCLN